jgi:hypothetical protein
MRLRQGIASYLAERGFEEIDQTLAQFNAPTLDRWEGSPRGYILEMTRHISDADLLEFGDYCNVRPIEDVPAATQNQIWPRAGFRLFLSHLSTRRQFCHELSTELSKLGVCCFVAHDSIDPDELWQRHIEAGLKTAQGLAALLEPDFHSSEWTDQEIGWAKGPNIPVYCIRHNKDPYGFVAERQGIAAPTLDNPKRLAASLTTAIQRIGEHKLSIAQGLLYNLRYSDSFNQSNLLAERISNQDYWSESLNVLLIDSIIHNRQVREADQVNNLLRVLLENSGGNWPV